MTQIDSRVSRLLIIFASFALTLGLQRPQHTPLTEMTSLTRTAAYLARRGTEAEGEGYQQRKARVLATLNAAVEVIR